jgi:hypothetical protein
MASDITLAVGDGARRMTYAELANVTEGYRCPRRGGLSCVTAGRARPAMTALSE